jgi:alanine dehydrogenase
MGASAALKADPGFAEGLNTFDGHLTYKAVAEAQQREFTPIEDIL